MTRALDVAVLTLFPQMFGGVMGESMWKRAAEQDLLHLKLVNFRDYAMDKHKTVDDYPFGGGAGMLLKPDPLFRAVESLLSADDEGNAAPRSARVILLSPQGRPFTQHVARELVDANEQLVLICGHYEGFDDRVRQHLVTDEISLGDFVLTGGEIVAMAMVDTMIRLIPGVLGNHESSADDSFATGGLEHPQYTRPSDYRTWPVPPVLLSGNHQEVARWRRRHALYRTWRRRPDLLVQLTLTVEERALIESWTVGDYRGLDVGVVESMDPGDGA